LEEGKRQFNKRRNVLKGHGEIGNDKPKTFSTTAELKKGETRKRSRAAIGGGSSENPHGGYRSFNTARRFASNKEHRGGDGQGLERDLEVKTLRALSKRTGRLQKSKEEIYRPDKRKRGLSKITTSSYGEGR